MRGISLIAAMLASLSLAACVSLGGDAPEKLITLTADAPLQLGTDSRQSGGNSGVVNEGTLADAIAIQVPNAPQRLNVNRVPVRVNASSLAYLADAFWVEKPNKLFQRVLEETIRAKGGRLVVSGGDAQYAAATQLSGELSAMDYDVTASSVTVRFDAMLEKPDGRILTKRFENVQIGVLPEVDFVAPAMNKAANAVAAEVADWVE